MSSAESGPAQGGGGWRVLLPLLMALVYDVVPVDLIPDVPVVGWVDDIGVSGAALLLAYAMWRRRRGDQPPA